LPWEKHSILDVIVEGFADLDVKRDSL